MQSVLSVACLFYSSLCCPWMYLYKRLSSLDSGAVSPSSIQCSHWTGLIVSGSLCCLWTCLSNSSLFKLCCLDVSILYQPVLPLVCLFCRSTAECAGSGRVCQQPMLLLLDGSVLKQSVLPDHVFSAAVCGICYKGACAAFGHVCPIMQPNLFALYSSLYCFWTCIRNMAAFAVPGCF
jgi:hypothetical protein